MVALVRAAEPLTEAQLQAVLRHRVASRGIDATAARLVHAALRQAVRPDRSTVGSGGLLRGNADRVAAGMLVNAGILTVDDHGDVELTAETRYALFV